MDVLVIGKNAEVLNAVKEGLIARSITDETSSPVAVAQVIATLPSDAARRDVACRFEITEDDGSYLMHLELKTECDVSVDAYHAMNGLHGIALARGRLPAGPFVFRIHETEIHRGPNVILLTLDGTELYFHKIERR